MRRMVKESLLKFHGQPLFPERRACTVPFKLSDTQAALYALVANYVREEFNRVEALEDDKRAVRAAVRIHHGHGPNRIVNGRHDCLLSANLSLARESRIAAEGFGTDLVVGHIFVVRLALDSVVGFLVGGRGEP